MTLEPYLFFKGRCEEAIAFYKEAIGAEVTSQMRMNEAPDPPPPGAIPPGFENKILHANLRIGAMNLMVSDGNSDGPPSFTGFTLSLGAADAAQAERSFNALARDKGGRVRRNHARHGIAGHDDGRKTGVVARTPSMERSTRAKWVEKRMRLWVSHSRSTSRVASVSASRRPPTQGVLPRPATTNKGYAPKQVTVRYWVRCRPNFLSI